MLATTSDIAPHRGGQMGTTPEIPAWGGTVPTSPPRTRTHAWRFAAGRRPNSFMNEDRTIGGAHTMIDMGPREFASGAVTRAGEGT